MIHVGWPHLAWCGFWWNSANLRDEDSLYGRPEDYRISGQVTFHGVPCLVLNSTGWTFYVGVSDHRLYGTVGLGASHCGHAEGVRDRDSKLPGILERLWTTPRRLRRGWMRFRRDRQRTVEAEKWRRAGPLFRPQFTTWYEDYKEFGPGRLVPMRQGTDEGFAGDQPVTATKFRHHLEVIDFITFDKPLLRSGSIQRWKEGSEVNDLANDPPINYVYKENFTPQEWQAILDEGNSRKAERATAESANQLMVGHPQIEFPGWLGSGQTGEVGRPEGESDHRGILGGVVRTKY